MASGPLSGIRVLEFTQIIAGPLGCQLLADLGADVIKVEPPEGDPWRFTQAFLPNESKSFIVLNRGKRSFAIDCSKPEAQEAIHRLVRDMDVVVINYRPDVAARLRIDYETLSAIKPDLIYVDNTAFGRAGDWASRPGYDIVVQALTGLVSTVGKIGEDGTPQAAQPPVADTTTGYALCAGVLAALFHRERTGEGQLVETSLLINALTIQMQQVLTSPVADATTRDPFLAYLHEAREEGQPYSEMLQVRDQYIRREGQNLYYRCYQTSDGVLAIGALSRSLREKVRRTLGIEHNRDEPGYDHTDPDQQAVDARAMAEVEALFRSNTTAYWEQRLIEGGIPVGPVLFAQELADHPQVRANEYMIELEHDLAGPIAQQAPPWKMSKTPPVPTKAAPPLGRDTDSILEALGYGVEEIAAMREAGTIL
jgi:crotonobetainyl-CoA:carnitine CoA-transferase CaiB-like acyl-CoA transferase